jgi:hypothetical protein
VGIATHKILFEHVLTGAPPSWRGGRNRRIDLFMNARNMLDATVERTDFKAYALAAIVGTAIKGRVR